MFVSLQYLRGVAALLVVYFHAVLQLQGPLARPATALPLFGSSGVDLFFVLSGFVMWTSTAGRSVSIGEFYRRRLVRIAPLYWLITAAAVLIGLIVPQLLRSTQIEWDHVGASLMFFPWPNPAFDVGSPEYLTPVVIPGWTLNYEMFFYALFGLALLVREERRFWAVGGLIVMALAAALAWGDRVDALRFYGTSLLLEFLAGVGIAILVARLPGRRWMAVAAVLLLLLLCTLEGLGLQTDRAAQFGVPAALIVLAASLAERAGAVPQSRWWLRTGDASYSIYLTHVFVIAALRVGANLTGWTIGNVAGEILFVLVALIASTLVGRLVYAWLERPLTRRAAAFALPRKAAADTAPHIA